MQAATKRFDSMKARSMNSRADIIFSAQRCIKKMKKTTGHRVRKEAGVYMATVLEYLVAEILEVAGDTTREFNKRRITPRTIMLSVRNDEELNLLTQKVHFPESGAIPFVQPSLLKSNSKNQKKKHLGETTTKKDNNDNGTGNTKSQSVF
ncbi:hypothetical protein FO519_008021 [Halicephalobus sp. NKZ332]|nr:hypothetical protein FO519_008021 [Halicephalobus sp. NKZ332]